MANWSPECARGRLDPTCETDVPSWRHFILPHDDPSHLPTKVEFMFIV